MALAFTLTPANEASGPPAERDAVRLLVARRGRPLLHDMFRGLPSQLRAGDLLVVNTSATMPAALSAGDIDVHLSTPLPEGPTRGGSSGGAAAAAGGGPSGGAAAAAGGGPSGGAAAAAGGGSSGGAAAAAGGGPSGGAAAAAGGGSSGGAAAAAGGKPSRGRPLWVVELRRHGARFKGGSAGQRLSLPGGASAELVAPYLSPGRLWIAALDLPAPLDDYLAEHGRPIAYAHLAEPRPLEDLQTIFADEPGSAEMPSAGRPFSERVLDDLHARGVQVAPLLLHTGVSSLELGERPYPERYRVSPLTATRVNAHRAAGGRVIAVGTTVVRALETVAGPDGRVGPGHGWTGLTVTPERGVRAVDGLLTGWHEPDASHLLMLEAVGGRELVERSYDAALAAGYRWHEFGDMHLILR